MRRPEVRLELIGLATCFAVGYVIAFPFALRAALRRYPKESS